MRGTIILFCSCIKCVTDETSVMQTHATGSLINASISRLGAMSFHRVAGINHQILRRDSEFGRSNESKLDCLDDVSTLDDLGHHNGRVSEECEPKYHIQQLMLREIAQETAVATFESISLDIIAHDRYMIDDHWLPWAKTFVYAESLQYRIRHHASNVRTALGQAWIRTTTIYSAHDPAEGISQTVTSFVFYPTAWLKCLGFQRGLEAIVSTAGQSWLLGCRLTVTTALPEDSLIFELCRTGQTRAVETMLEKRLSSVLDTSPKGWKPLHVSS